MDFLKSVTADANTAITELLDHAQLEKGKIVVIGCSTSEVSWRAYWQGFERGSCKGRDGRRV